MQWLNYKNTHNYYNLFIYPSIKKIIIAKPTTTDKRKYEKLEF